MEKDGLYRGFKSLFIGVFKIANDVKHKLDLFLSFKVN